MYLFLGTLLIAYGETFEAILGLETPRERAIAGGVLVFVIVALGLVGDRGRSQPSA